MIPTEANRVRNDSDNLVASESRSPAADRLSGIAGIPANQTAIHLVSFSTIITARSCSRLARRLLSIGATHSIENPAFQAASQPRIKCPDASELFAAISTPGVIETGDPFRST